MSKLINVGFGNVVNSDKIVAVVSPEAAPIKRMVQKAKEETGWWMRPSAAEPRR